MFEAEVVVVEELVVEVELLEIGVVVGDKAFLLNLVLEEKMLNAVLVVFDRVVVGVDILIALLVEYIRMAVVAGVLMAEVVFDGTILEVDVLKT